MQVPAQVIAEMEPEELGARLLLLMQKVEVVTHPDGLFHVNDSRRLLGYLLEDGEQAVRRGDEVMTAFTEAWVWLEVQGLLVPPANGMNPTFRVLSRRARRFQNLADFVPYQIARRLDREMLNPRIREEVWAAFIRGHFDIAVNIAVQAIEFAVREAAGYGDDMHGQPMIAKAFAPEGGPLTDMTAVDSERKAMRDLFIGAFGTHRNPRAHRKVTVDDVTEVIEIVLLANHLLRIVDRRKANLDSARANATI